MQIDAESVIQHLRHDLANAKSSDHDYCRNEPLVYPTVTQVAIAEAEQRLGFRLPPLLVRIFTEIGNGGYMLGPGLVGLPGGFPVFDKYDLVSEYLESKDYYRWRAPYLVLTDWGCCMLSYVDCREPDGPVYRWDGNGYDDEADRNHDSPNESYWTLERESLSSWLVNPLSG